MARGESDPDMLYARVSADYGAALARLARAYEHDVSHCADLLHDIHIALWRSFDLFDERCSLRTWVYRVAHNVAASHSLRQKRRNKIAFAGIEDLEAMPAVDNPEQEVGERAAQKRLMTIIYALKMPDRQIMTLYLEELDAVAIGEIVGLSAGAVATKIHRIKALLAKNFQSGGSLND
jgi:RNA polymerase sigma factor (sigma-70 family)